jgi:hypothetical protein
MREAFMSITAGWLIREGMTLCCTELRTWESWRM